MRLSCLVQIQNQIAAGCDGEAIKVSVLHWDPFFKEPLVQESGPLQDASALQLRGDQQADLEIIRIAEIGMQAVGSFHDIQPLGLNGDRLFKPE